MNPAARRAVVALPDTAAASAAAAEFGAIDWARPWLAPYRERGERVARRISQGASVAQALNDEGDTIALASGRLRFVPHAALAKGVAYEVFIATAAQVPTRDNLHDFFNGLVWLHQPALKRRLNELQAQAIARQGDATLRGRERDALTLFDENAALLRAPAELIAALANKDWHSLFVTRRRLWADATLTLFGHALLEKLVTPRKAVTAHVWVLPPDGSAPIADALLAAPWLPLPVLGVPGWYADNGDPRFYVDAEVFRPPR